LEEKGDEAEAICLQSGSDSLIKLRLWRRNDIWYLVEILQADTDLHLVSELLQPTIATIEKTRRGEKGPAAGRSDFLRVLFFRHNNSAKTVEVANDLLKVKPADKGLRLLKALALINLGSGDETDVEKIEEAKKILRELSNEGFAPALYNLVDYLSGAEEEKDQEEALPLYERYLSLEPYDVRALANLARAYETAENFVKAEAAYRKALEYDPGDSYNHLGLMVLLVRRDRISEIKPLLVAAEKLFGGSEDVFGSALDYLVLNKEYKLAEKFAASEPLRMKSSVGANLAMGRMYSASKRYAEALRFFNTAAQLDKKSALPHVSLATVYRLMSNWNAALKSAQQAINLDVEDSEAHYERACALARLGRIKEAMSALEKAVELDPEQAEWIVDEEDLKALASLPAFKKLIPPPENP